MNNDFLRNRTALVTGSVQGIGRAIASTLAQAGMRIAVHGLATPDEAEEAVAAMLEAGAPEARFFGADMRDPDEIDAMMDAIVEWGGVDVLVNNAGIQKTASLPDLTPEIWNAVLAVNLSGAFHTMRRALPEMAKNGYGRVVNIASVHGLVASTNKAPYVASKFGLVGLSKVAALEYASTGTRDSGGVTINCICPGWTETAIIEPQILARAAELGGDRDAGVAGILSEKQPSLRISQPEEIGTAVLWLASPIAHNITGISLPIDGGWTAQ